LVTRFPPYEYEWTWSSQQGSTFSYSLSASRYSGQMSCSVDGSSEPGGAYGSIDQICSVGIFFRPPNKNGLLTLSSVPSFDSSYETVALFASIRTNSWVGLYAEQFNASDNSHAGAILDQRSNTVFDLDTFYFYDGGSRSFSNTGFPLSAQFPVDNTHWYTLWVQCGGHASGGGVVEYASSTINVSVGSITWSYASLG